MKPNIEPMPDKMNRHCQDKAKDSKSAPANQPGIEQRPGNTTNKREPAPTNAKARQATAPRTADNAKGESKPPVKTEPQGTRNGQREAAAKAKRKGLGSDPRRR